MNEILKKLVALTEVDAAIAKLKEQLGQYPALLARMQEAEGRQQKALDEAETAIEAARQDRRKAEKEMQVLQEQIRKYTGQQSAVKTNKEYQAITHEIDGLKGKIDGWETVGLEKLEAEEASAGKKKSAAEQLQKIRGENETERRRIETQIAEKREKLERLAGERQRRFDDIPEEWQEEYQILDDRAPGTACAPLEGDNCGGCHWSLVPHTRQLVRKGDDMIRCDHCRRILYAPERVG